MRETKASRSLLRQVVGTDDDFEWYPTTAEIIDVIKADIKSHTGRYGGGGYDSMLDIGAGDGRVLESVGLAQQYAIEKSIPLVEAMNKSIFVVGTDFQSQTLIDKKVDCIFSNPPYSDYVSWTTKIISEANCKAVYLVIPERWSNSAPILEAVKKRDAKTSVLGKFDFLDAPRRARAKVEIVRIMLANRYDNFTDPFDLWFDETFKISAKRSSSSSSSSAFSDSDKAQIKKELVAGGDLIQILERLYLADLARLYDTYRSLEKIDASIMAELEIDIRTCKERLKMKIEGIKSLYWQELFDNLTKITSRLTHRSRERMLSKLMANTTVDFSASNSYAILVWVIRRANDYFNSQLVDTFERLVDYANIKLYKSNMRTFGQDAWRYCRRPEELDCYGLDYRVVVNRMGGIYQPGVFGYQRSINGLHETAALFIGDLRTIASNLGFDIRHQPGVEQHHWTPGAKVTFDYNDSKSGKSKQLMEVKAYKNGNLHMKFNQQFIKKLNVEFGRLKGWLKTPADACREMELSEEEAKQYFKSNQQLIESPKMLLLEN